MLRNYLTTAVRALRRRPGFTLLNVAGLAVGMACCLLIGRYVQHEVSYDRFHENAGRLYRVAQTGPGDDMARTGGAMAPALAADFPQVEATVRLYRDAERIAAVDPARPGQQRYFEEAGFLYADANFFEVFSFPFARGQAQTALARPGTVVLSQQAAARYFGEADPMGQTLTLATDSLDLTVTGVLEMLPSNSHLSFDLVTSLATFKQAQGMPTEAEFTSYWWPFGWTYALLREGARPEAVEAQLPAFTERRRPGAAEFVPQLQPITDIHLHSDLSGEAQAGGSAQTVYVVAVIALFILIIACVNFVNLATARAAERAREVGVRKTAGAHRGQLVAQFLGESLLLSGAALVLAVLLARAALPVFNSLAGTQLGLGYDTFFWAGLAAIFALTGLGAGSYPAFALSRFQPAEVLRGGRAGLRGARLRKGLVVFQFAASIGLIAVTVVAFQQLDYLRTARLGFDEHRVAVLSGNANAAYGTLRAELLGQAGVEGVTSAQQRPGFGTGMRNPFQAEGGARLATESETDEANRIHYQHVGAGYFELMNLEMIAGRGFEEGREADLGRRLSDSLHAGAFFRDRAKVINETAARRLGWTPEEAIGKTFRLFNQEGGLYYLDTEGPIVGVVEDFHATSLREKIQPMAFDPAAFPGTDFHHAGTVLVKLAPGGNAEGAMATLQEAWQRVLPDRPVEASFLDADLATLYAREQRLGQIFGLFTGLALFIACLGLFGLAAYAAERRAKEIAVRKALGATARQVVLLLSKDFLTLVALGFALAVPVAWLAMQRWLDGFAYRVELSPWAFAGAGAAALLIAAATVSTQALRAARTNPARALRDE